MSGVWLNTVGYLVKYTVVCLHKHTVRMSVIYSPGVWINILSKCMLLNRLPEDMLRTIPEKLLKMYPMTMPVTIYSILLINN